MALNFPANPSIGQTYTLGNRTWEWNGTGWRYKVAQVTPSGGGITEAEVLALTIALG